MSKTNDVERHIKWLFNNPLAVSYWSDIIRKMPRWFANTSPGSQESPFFKTLDKFEFSHILSIYPLHPDSNMVVTSPLRFFLQKKNIISTNAFRAKKCIFYIDIFCTCICFCEWTIKTCFALGYKYILFSLIIQNL